MKHFRGCNACMNVYMLILLNFVCVLSCMLCCDENGDGRRRSSTINYFKYALISYKYHFFWLCFSSSSYPMHVINKFRLGFFISLSWRNEKLNYKTKTEKKIDPWSASDRVILSGTCLYFWTVREKKTKFETCKLFYFHIKLDKNTPIWSY